MEGTTTISNEEYLRLKKLEEAFKDLAGFRLSDFSGIKLLNETEVITELNRKLNILHDNYSKQKAIYTMGYTSNEDIKHWSIWDFLRKKRNIYK